MITDTGLPFIRDDIQLRLCKSLVKHKGLPFYIEEFDGITLHGFYTSTGERAALPLPVSDFDLRPVTLGYMNTGKEAVYATRCPERRYKHGLTTSNLRLSSRRMIGPRDYLTSKYLADCIMNVYPSMQDAIALAKETEGSAGFHRRWAVEYVEGAGMFFLCYRGGRVGWFAKGVPCLGEGNEYLKEELQVCLT